MCNLILLLLSNLKLLHSYTLLRGGSNKYNKGWLIRGTRSALSSSSRRIGKEKIADCRTKERSLGGSRD
jgi:hypothetical protein